MNKAGDKNDPSGKTGGILCCETRADLIRPAISDIIIVCQSMFFSGEKNKMTDYSAYIDSFRGIACVISLRKMGESMSDRITVAAANKKYLASVNKLDDEMIISVAGKIRSVFDTDDIYRAGGDEFLVISTDLDEKEFYLRFERLKEISRIAGEPSFALGADFAASDINIEKIMHTADQNMYKNKAEYYENTPGADRRRR